MALKIRSIKDFNAGLMFIGIGLVFALGANQYPMGTAVRMGPAYFPTWLGWGTIALGTFVFIESFLVDEAPPSKVAWRALILVLASVLSFGALINSAGLIPATVAVIIISALAGHEFTWRASLISATVLSIAVWAIFSKGLGLPFKLFPWSF